MLTDITIKNLESDRQTRYWDATLPGFGILVGKRRKTFILMRGKRRKIITLGTFPVLRTSARMTDHIISDAGGLSSSRQDGTCRR